MKNSKRNRLCLTSALYGSWFVAPQMHSDIVGTLKAIIYPYISLASKLSSLTIFLGQACYQRKGVSFLAISLVTVLIQTVNNNRFIVEVL